MANKARSLVPTYPAWALVGGTSRPAGETVCLYLAGGHHEVVRVGLGGAAVAVEVDVADVEVLLVLAWLEAVPAVSRAAVDRPVHLLAAPVDK